MKAYSPNTLFTPSTPGRDLTIPERQGVPGVDSGSAAHSNIYADGKTLTETGSPRSPDDEPHYLGSRATGLVVISLWAAVHAPAALAQAFAMGL